MKHLHYMALLLLLAGAVSSGSEPQLYVAEGAQAELIRRPSDRSRAETYNVIVRKPGRGANEIQLNFLSETGVKAGTACRIELRAASSIPTEITMRAIGNAPPYPALGNGTETTLSLTRKWQHFRLDFTASVEAKTIRVPMLFLGDVPAGCTIRIADVKFRELRGKDLAVDLAPVANMGFRDEVEGDGTGGWSDQGPANDAAGFDFRKGETLPVPFQITDPEKNEGRAVITFHSAAHFPSGPVEAAVKCDAERSFLYVLHTMAWGNSGTPWEGEILLSGENGTQKIAILGGRELADMWNPHDLPNGAVAAKWPNGSGTATGFYLSKFEVDPAIGKIRTIRFRTGSGEPVWIVAGVTLSDRAYTIRNQTKNLRIERGERWKELRRTESPCVVPGSVLDLSFLVPRRADRRIIVNAAGHLACEDAPETPVRFFATSSSEIDPAPLRPCGIPLAGSGFTSKADIDEFVLELRRGGCNMYKLEIPPQMIRVEDGKATLDPEMLDRIDYFLFRCRENGIYIMLNAMSSDCGYIGVANWTKESYENSRKRFMKFNILFDESARDNWRIGVGAFLTHRNPYTALPLAEDPLLAVITCFNEQEFAFIRGGAGQKDYSWDKALPEFRNFLGKPDALMFSRRTWDSPTDEGVQVNRFITKKWRELYAWYNQELRKMGYRGITTLWDMTKSMHYNNLRTEAELITMHTYHAHVGGDPRYPSRQNMSSDLASGATQARYNAGSRITGRPFFLNEYATVFCNRYRYEESFSFAAFAAFQGYDGIMRHNHTIHSKRGNFIFPWMPFEDPVARASMTTAALMFGRGDVSEGKRGVTLLFTERGIEEARAWNKPVTGDLSALAPAVRLGVAKEGTPLPPGELALPLRVGGKLLYRDWESTVAEEPAGDSARFAETLARLRTLGILSPGNRSRNRDLLESSTGELFLDAKRSYMTIDTERLQGMCSLAGGRAELKASVLENLTTPGSLVLAAMEGMRPVAEAKRLLAVYATNALHEGMVFEDESMEHCLDFAAKNNPAILVETGKFRITLRRKSEKPLRAWALAMNGERRTELPVIRRPDGTQILEVDTAALPEGPSLYFELAEE